VVGAVGDMAGFLGRWEREMARVLRWLVLTGLVVAGCAGPGGLGSPSSLPGTVVVTRPFAPGCVWISHFGLPPQLLSATRIRGDGIAVLGTDGAGREIWWMNSGEADPPVEVEFAKASEGELQIEYSTRDARGGPAEYVPFRSVTVRVNSGATVVEEDRLLLEGEPFDADRAGELPRLAEEAMASEDPDREEAFEACLMGLRNMGISAPERVLGILGRLSARADGAYAELIAGYREEVETARRICAQ
jgi:hypothetical protein